MKKTRRPRWLRNARTGLRGVADVYMPYVTDLSTLGRRQAYRDGALIQFGGSGHPENSPIYRVKHGTLYRRRD